MAGKNLLGFRFNDELSKWGKACNCAGKLLPFDDILGWFLILKKMIQIDLFEFGKIFM